MSAISKGLEGVVANDTRLGDVRGQEGQLVYCGYDIIKLAGKASFEEVIYLLWSCADHDQPPPHQRTHAAERYAKLIDRNGRFRRFRHAKSKRQTKRIRNAAFRS